MNERAAFEANIDRDPTDATNHLVYADWLQENGEPEEAEFRRKMGEWHNRGEGNTYTHHPDDPYGYDYDFPIRVKTENLPQYINLEKFPNWHMGTSEPPEGPEFDHVPGWSGFDFRWKNYRGMERAFRRQFLGNHYTSDAAEQLSRRSRFSRTLNKYR